MTIRMVYGFFIRYHSFQGDKAKEIDFCLLQENSNRYDVSKVLRSWNKLWTRDWRSAKRFHRFTMTMKLLENL